MCTEENPPLATAQGHLPSSGRRRWLRALTAGLAHGAFIHPARFAAATQLARPALACSLGLLGQRAAQAAERMPVLRAPRLRPGDTIGLVAPSNAMYEKLPFDMAVDTLQALGFKVREGRHLRARWGQFAGTDAQRAADLNAMFADPDVHGVMALTGGSGANRVLPLLDYAALRRTPKFVGGYSDITALVNGIHARTGLVTFHSPVADSEWNGFSWAQFKSVVLEAQSATMKNPVESGDLPAPRESRIQTLRPGVGRGPLVGGNLAVLSSLAGSPYMPSFDGAILFLEDVNEYIYRVDRMLSTLKLCGALDRLSGVVLGAFTNCKPGDGFGVLTLDEVFDDYFGPLGIPVYRGAQFGHIKRKFTLPVGAPAEIDATAGTIRLLQPAVT